MGATAEEQWVFSDEEQRGANTFARRRQVDTNKLWIRSSRNTGDEVNPESCTCMDLAVRDHRQSIEPMPSEMI